MNWTELNHILPIDLLKDILVLLVLVILNKAAINLHVQDFGWVKFFLMSITITKVYAVWS